ncbi:MAG: PilZ domain-containing protein [Lachnospiraceae bacterium]|nr:PilZ domain-containing protein [Lachnospiraceae bacterium]
MAQDNRKSLRTVLEAEIAIKPIGSNVYGTPMLVEIENVSKNGIGFICDGVLETGNTYEASLKIWTDETLEVFLKIVRCDQVGNRFAYGAIFIGMSDVDAGRIETYQTILNMKGQE